MEKEDMVLYDMQKEIAPQKKYEKKFFCRLKKERKTRVVYTLALKLKQQEFFLYKKCDTFSSSFFLPFAVVFWISIAFS
jgi:hypothetical protein